MYPRVRSTVDSKKRSVITLLSVVLPVIRTESTVPD